MIFYHVTAQGEYRTVLLQQMSSILLSDLYSRVDAIYVFVLGARTEDVERASGMVLDFGRKVQVVQRSTDAAKMERFTLESMGQYVTARDRILYMHTKGISYEPGSDLGMNTYWWTLLMEYHLLQGHAKCIALLDEYDVVGVKWEDMQRPDARPGSHFSGNFWWANGAYVLSLDTSIAEQYHDPELFIGSQNPRFYSLWQVPTKDSRVAVLHDLPYSPKHYVDATARQKALHVKHSM